MFTSMSYKCVSAPPRRSPCFADLHLYSKPFLITYLCTASFSFYLIRPSIQYLRSLRRTKTEEHDTVPSLGGYTRGVPRRKSTDRVSLYVSVLFRCYMRP